MDERSQQLLRDLPYDLAADILEGLPQAEYSFAIHTATLNCGLAREFHFFTAFARTEAEANIYRRHFPQADIRIGDCASGWAIRESDPVRALELYLRVQRKEQHRWN